MPKIFVLLFMAGFLYSCKPKNDKQFGEITGSWRLADEQLKNNKAGFDADVRANEVIRNGALLSFFSDSSFTLLRGEGKYEQGTWTSGKDGLIKHIRFGKMNEPALCHVRSIGKGTDRLSIIRNGAETEYVKEAVSIKLCKEDPFHPTNNLWRLQPQKKESYQQLVNRVAGYCKHVALILKAGVDRKQRVFDFGFSQGPIQIYQNAIGIYDYEIVPDYWKACFYNEADASSAYYIYRIALNKSVYRGGANNTWMESDYKILLSIYSTLMSMGDEIGKNTASEIN